MAASRPSSTEDLIFDMSDDESTSPTVPTPKSSDAFYKPTHGVGAGMISAPRTCVPKVSSPEISPAEISVPEKPASTSHSPRIVASEESSSDGSVTDPEKEEDTDRAVSLLSWGFFDLFMRHLESLNRNVHGTVLEAFKRNGKDVPSDDEYKAAMSARMEEIIPAPLLAKVDKCKPLIINIRGLIERGSREDTHLFPEVPSSGSIIPTKMVQSRGEVIKEVENDFSDMLRDAILVMFDERIGRDYGGQIGWTLAVQENLHQKRHGLKLGMRCCVFLLMEEDYGGGDQIKPNQDVQVGSFSIMCRHCRRRHDIHIYR